MPRFFTLPQAEKLLPDLEDQIRECLTLKSKYQHAEQQITDISRSIVMTGGMNINRDQVIQIKENREQSAGRLQELFELIQSSGCLVKDLDIGLLDFPTLYHEEEVYLCWKFGESNIAFWHGTQEGYGGRKPIDQEFLANHKGDS